MVRKRVELARLRRCGEGVRKGEEKRDWEMGWNDDKMDLYGAVEDERMLCHVRL